MGYPHAESGRRHQRWRRPSTPRRSIGASACSSRAQLSACPQSWSLEQISKLSSLAKWLKRLDLKCSVHRYSLTIAHNPAGQNHRVSMKEYPCSSGLNPVHPNGFWPRLPKRRMEGASGGTPATNPEIVMKVLIRVATRDWCASRSVVSVSLKASDL